jgi:AraC family transcriptional regulator, mar-sox-rob regulon activator
MTSPIKKSIPRVRARVLHILLAAPVTGLSAGQLARQLHMSESTLRRRLREEKTSYRQLLEEVRRYRCDQALDNPRIGGKVLAAQLGFQQTNSFYRAFTRWTGIPWREYKRECGRAQPV